MRCYYVGVELMESKIVAIYMTKIVCDGVDVTDDLMPEYGANSSNEVVEVVYSDKYEGLGRVGGLTANSLISVELKPKHVVVEYSDGMGDIYQWPNNPGVNWGRDGYKENCKPLEFGRKFITGSGCEETKLAMDDREALLADIKGKTKELSTIAGYLAVSICINFVAIGWVAWTKGWLS